MSPVHFHAHFYTFSHRSAHTLKDPWRLFLSLGSTFSFVVSTHLTKQLFSYTSYIYTLNCENNSFTFINISLFSLFRPVLRVNFSPRFLYIHFVQPFVHFVILFHTLDDVQFSDIVRMIAWRDRCERISRVAIFSDEKNRNKFVYLVSLEKWLEQLDRRRWNFAYSRSIVETESNCTSFSSSVKRSCDKCRFLIKTECKSRSRVYVRRCSYVDVKSVRNFGEFSKAATVRGDGPKQSTMERVLAARRTSCRKPQCFLLVWLPKRSGRGGRTAARVHADELRGTSSRPRELNLPLPWNRYSYLPRLGAYPLSFLLLFSPFRFVSPSKFFFTS